jgi:hypothetical protein
MKKIRPILSLIYILLIVNCSSGYTGKDVYKIPKPDDCLGSPSRNIEITMNQDSTYSIKALSDSAKIPMIMNSNFGVERYCLATLGSRNLHIEVDKTVGTTKFAGLFFTGSVVIQINMDSTIELDKENIVLKDYANKTWESKKIKIDGKEGIFLLKRQKD